MLLTFLRLKNGQPDFLQVQVQMKYLILVKSSPSKKSNHSFLLNLLRCIETSKDQIQGVFFTGKAAEIAGSMNNGDAALLKKEFVSLNEEFQIKLFVCGYAFRQIWKNVEAVDSHFVISGNMELSVLAIDSDRLMEF